MEMDEIDQARAYRKELSRRFGETPSPYIDQVIRLAELDLRKQQIAQMERLIRAVEELGFNGATSRMRGSESMGIGERIVIALDKIAEMVDDKGEG